MVQLLDVYHSFSRPGHVKFLEVNSQCPTIGRIMTLCVYLYKDLYLAILAGEV